MRIAVTYDNGNVFSHFGRTEAFKVYEVEEGEVTSSRVISSNGAGHGALAGVLAEEDVDLLICGGIGGGALNALDAAGIEVIAGATGNTDEVVEAFLRGELEDSGAVCDHHHGEGHDCGHHEGGGCHGEEGGCCSGAGKERKMGKNTGKQVKVHYRGTLDDGSQFDSSYDRGEPLAFTCGAGQMIAGFDAAVADMELGDIVQVHLLPSEAYGEWSPQAVIVTEISSLPGSENLEVGQTVHLVGPAGQPFPVKVTAKDDTTISLDANHELAGKALNFQIELVEVK